jgi:hypothetical protein
MRTKQNETDNNRLFKIIKWQLTALSGALTTGMIVVLES